MNTLLRLRIIKGKKNCKLKNLFKVELSIELTPKAR